MMLKPAMYQIIGKKDSYYKFVVAVAKRARQIAVEAETNKELADEKPVKVAVNEFATGKCRADFSQH